jgi:hypothetical protein
LEDPEEDAAELPLPEPIIDSASSLEEKYFRLFISALHVSAQYKPKFGQRDDVSLEQFRMLYGSDPFYHWVGMDSPRMYAAHKAAGGMTSVYRQLGIGGEWVFRAMLQDTLHLSREEVSWSYIIPKADGKTKKLTLDARIHFEHVRDDHVRQRLIHWVHAVKTQLLLPTEKNYQGIVFEVRQGYKSMDSKRQNADVDNATNAHLYDYLPVLLLLSQQINADLINRYLAAHLLILVGTPKADPLTSTYSFCREIIGYDLGAFFEAYSEKIKAELETVLQHLLEA